MKATRTDCRVARYLPGMILVAGLLCALSGCGTFNGMSWEERDQANKDLANESNYWWFKPERSLYDNHETHVP